METNVKKISRDGLEISLMDGSKWRLIYTGDMTKTILWYPTQRIRIEEVEKNEYVLINLDTAAPDEIRVSRIG